MSLKSMYNYVSETKYKCHICTYSYDNTEEFSKHITYYHNIYLPENKIIKKWIINSFNINNKNITNDEDLCVICLDRKKTTAFFRCGHKICCLHCAKEILHVENKDDKKCPICRKIVGGILRIYE